MNEKEINELAKLISNLNSEERTSTLMFTYGYKMGRLTAEKEQSKNSDEKDRAESLKS